MTDLDWSSAIEIGHAEIDAQHRRLLLLCEAVVESLIKSAKREPHSAQLQSLIDFTQEHFAFEEGLMRSAGYPRLDQHAKNHASLLRELRTYCYKVQQGQDINPVGLISFVWFTLHIESADRELVVWLRSQQADGGG
ncbi:MAG: hemerythrin family protein [Betaproteobacteria bacterium]|nr:hemerythrin family protein [Betaproteobacteria bacterium]